MNSKPDKLAAAIAKARTLPAACASYRWSICIRDESGEVAAQFSLASQEQVSRLALELTLLGYGIDPTDPSACDVAFAPAHAHS